MERGATIRHRRDLHKLFPDIHNVVAVELGVAEGYFSQDILSWGVARLYAVDLWETHTEFFGDAGSEQEWHNKNYSAARKRLDQYGERCIILRGPTTQMGQHVKEQVDFINVDACHSYSCVQNDIAAWWPKLKKGGVMAFHDYEMRQYGVKQAVLEHAAAHGLEIHLLPEDKQEDAGAWIMKP